MPFSKLCGFPPKINNLPDMTPHSPGPSWQPAAVPPTHNPCSLMTEAMPASVYWRSRLERCMPAAMWSTALGTPTYWGRGGVVVRLLTSNLGKPVTIVCGVAPVFSHLRRVPDDAADRFSRGSPVYPAFSFQRCSILTSLQHISSEDLEPPKSLHSLMALLYYYRLPYLSCQKTPSHYFLADIQTRNSSLESLQRDHPRVADMNLDNISDVLESHACCAIAARASIAVYTLLMTAVVKPVLISDTYKCHIILRFSLCTCNSTTTTTTTITTTIPIIKWNLASIKATAGLVLAELKLLERISRAQPSRFESRSVSFFNRIPVLRHSIRTSAAQRAIPLTGACRLADIQLSGDECSINTLEKVRDYQCSINTLEKVRDYLPSGPTQGTPNPPSCRRQFFECVNCGVWQVFLVILRNKRRSFAVQNQAPVRPKRQRGVTRVLPDERISVLGAEEVEARWVWSSTGIKWWGKQEIPEKTHRPAASSGTITTCKNKRATSPGIDPGPPRWEASSLTTTSPRPTLRSEDQSRCFMLGWYENHTRIRYGKVCKGLANATAIFYKEGIRALANQERCDMEKFLFSVLSLERQPGALYQEDNARPHAAQIVRWFLDDHHVSLFPWPERSPGLSLIEIVWSMVGR
ncbi:hypothetical protein PR048_011983 [Dryococelus australis]|uniref:Tc1-like transposase DDE domain-containing protein n=1 Tax=Dryococelus australis TaxID=614101 RepID=A0ABQ9HN52_9NEOP|nr:hypothetical protein PR048_011983 [Dryococelus australis]